MHYLGQHLAAHGFPVQHESRLALIGDGRDHIDPALGGADPCNRSFPLEGKHLGVACIVLNAGLVDTQWISAFSCLARAWTAGKPPLAIARRAWDFAIGPLGRTLLDENPPFQVVDDGPQRHAEPVHLLDRQSHGSADPQGVKGQFELVRLFAHRSGKLTPPAVSRRRPPVLKVTRNCRLGSYRVFPALWRPGPQVRTFTRWRQ